MSKIHMGGIHQTLAGYYKVSVVDGQTDKVVWEQPEEQKNLVLNQGMDAINSFFYVQVTNFAISGDGPRLNYIDPAGSQLSQTGTTITLVPTGSGTGLNHLTESFGNYTTALVAGDVIEYATGSGGTTHVQVLGVSDLTASVDTSLTISPAQNFIIWKTTQTNLQHELQRSNTYLAGFNGVTDATGSRIYTRTYDFLTESVAKTYREVGVGWSATSGSATVFSRVVLDSPVLVDVGQKLRVLYRLRVGFSPTASISRPNVTISGWPVAPATNTNGSESIQGFLASTMDVNGNGDVSSGCLDPAGDAVTNFQVWISTSTASLSTFGGSTDRTGVSPTAAVATGTKLAYTNGSYTCDKTATFTAVSFNGTNIGSMGFGRGSGGSAYLAGFQAFAFVFNQTQSKANTQTLTLSWRWTWAREFLN